MLIQGSLLSSRTEYLLKEYTNLIDRGINAAQILVLLQNPYKKSLFIENFKKTTNCKYYTNPQIHTFYGLVYNTVLANWPVLENMIEQGEPTISPNMTGLEISQFFFKNAVKDAGFKDYNSKINLIHQLFRRNSLITNNSLSDKEVEERVRVLKEAFAPDAKTAIDIFKKKTLEYRTFDYIRQINLFEYIYKNTDHFKYIKYLIVDDADEITTAEYEFIKHLKPSLKKVLIGYDKYGSSRLGFLNTDIKTIENIETLFETEEKIELDNLEKAGPVTNSNSYTRRQEMINELLNKIDLEIKKGASPSEIAIVTPIIDTGLKFSISEAFDKKNIKYQYLSGSEKLISIPQIRNTVTLLNLASNLEVDIFRLRSVLTETGKIPIKYCMELINNFTKNKSLSFVDLGVEKYNKALSELISVIEELQKTEQPLSQKVYFIYKKLYEDKLSSFENKKYSFFLKQITDFEAVFNKYKNHPKLQHEIIMQLENSIISENPSSAPEILEDAIIISTPQKIIDFSIRKKHLFLADTTSSEWTKEDLGTIYNAWVYQKSWDKDKFTYEDNLEFSKEKYTRCFRKLSFIGEEIYDYSSIFDVQGCENIGGIKNYIEEEKQNIVEDINFNFTPREDQKPVLEYKTGNMAISAVPGAGKTTILLALIIKLLQNKINSENIFVLTYMESAARNFKERIKKACPNLEKLPNISTIHGLALRILKENSNFIKVGLDENFEVCDDNKRQKIIHELMYKSQTNSEDFDKYEKSISVLKLSNIAKLPYVKDFELQKFIKFFHRYNLYLKDRNLIDYDDMLVFSVKILEQNPDIAEHYQDICKFLIEDEAQDSSGIQQKLLSILSKKHKNLIRCGDINQAITTTFTNADVDGFKVFIQSSNNVEMNRSQRCCKDVYELANRLIEFSSTDKNQKNAFFKIEMKPVEGRNPESKNAITTRLFDSYIEERNYIIENVRKIFNENNEASVAILVRNNNQITEYSSFLTDYGYNVITRSDALNQQPVFSLIYNVIKFCTHPWNNENVLECAKCLKNQKLLNFSENDIERIKSLTKPFILTEQNVFKDTVLSQFWLDMNYWVDISQRFFTDEIDELALKIGNYYYQSEIEKSNVNMISILLKRTAALYSDPDLLLERLNAISARPISGQFRFFENEEKEDSSQETSSKGKIKIMTYHKSKGDEFDCVFLPELTEEKLHLIPQKIKINTKLRFIESVKAMNPSYKKKDEQELKIFQIEENLRLLYVAITRAKKKLFITSAQKYKTYSSIKKAEPSPLFNTLFERYCGEKV